MNVPDSTTTEGAALFGVDPLSLAYQGGSDGAVYLCRRGSRACLLKFVPLPPEKLPAYDEKLAFISYLAENGVALAVPQESRSGRCYETLPAAEGLYAVTLTEKVGGRHPTPCNLCDWNERLFACWGQVMGRMHALTRAYPRWQKSTPGEDGQPSQIDDWQAEYEFFAGWCQEPKITAQWTALHEQLAALPRERSGFGLVHNDLHMWNILYHPDASGQPPITIIDFDVCAYQWLMTDIAIPTYHGMVFNQRQSLSQREHFARRFLQHFMAGYCLENNLAPDWFQYLPLFLRYREILIYVVFSNEWPADNRRRWQVAMLAEKRARILRGEALIGML